MSRHLATRVAAYPMLLGFFILGNMPLRTSADEQADAVAAIERLGGSVRAYAGKGEELEVEFHLRGRELNDDGLAHVAALDNVVSLNLRDTKITSGGLVHLKGLTKLRWLHLERTVIGDDGIQHLAGLVNLEYLNLYGTKITDKALEQLSPLKRLTDLYVWQTGVTDEGVGRLEKALPELRIVRGVDLSKLPATFPIEAEKPKPTKKLEWFAVARRDQAPARSQNGLNVQIYFENKSEKRVKIYWIAYGGELKLYGELDPGGTRQQNTYSRNAWLITDEKEQPLGYFVAEEDESLAVIPGA